MGPAGPLPPLREGSIVLVAEPSPVFRPIETLSFAYQIYNAHRSRRQPDLDVEYRFSMEVADGLHQVGRSILLQHLTSETLAYSLPLQGWPEAAYRIEIRVTDNLSKLSVTGEAPFMVRSAGRQGP